MTTRAEFIARIRAEMGKTRGLPPAAPARRPERPRAAAEAIRRELAERWPEALERFRRELEQVGGVFYRVPTLAEAAPVVAGIARDRGARRLVGWHAAEIGGDLVPALAALGLEAVSMPPGEVASAAERRRLRELVAAAELGLTGADLDRRDGHPGPPHRPGATALDVAPAVLSHRALRPDGARRVARSGRCGPRVLACRRSEPPRRRRHQLHHRAEPDGGHRADAHARRPRAEGGARHLRRGAGRWLTATSARARWRR